MGQRHEGTEDAWEGSPPRTLWGGATAGSPAIYPGRNRVLRRIGGPAGFREHNDDRPDGLFDRHRTSRGKRGSRSAGHTVIVRNLPQGSGHRSSPLTTADGWRSPDPSSRQPPERYGQASATGTSHEKERTAAYCILGTCSSRWHRAEDRFYARRRASRQRCQRETGFRGWRRSDHLEVALSGDGNVDRTSNLGHWR